MRAKVKVIERGPHWTVMDLELAYRICNSYQDSKYDDDPSHVHDRFDEVVAPCSVADASEAFRVMMAYRQKHSALDIAALEEEIHGSQTDQD